ncbi:PREDICTED: RING-H2 finger protein ATL78-like [Nicotiana attenuata]|uniref:RING-type E3 ubiquitin transferase n=1 Tax=Nicotiana attenuata TaxID=49451 RepID=A0A314L2Z7_NICAT|nr:PREDICTED: RING-H2 finger protein ATL78-like [Nicotiana attenuata]OIT35389.1 ring-h2 finger protein atl78 [Nicotiana attenuata]
MATSSTLFIQEFTENFHYSRRLLLIPTTVPQNHPEATMAPPPAAEISHVNTFDANVIMVLSVLVCALICSLALNSIIKCALRCSSQLVSAPDSSSNHRNPSAPKLANTGIKKKALKTFPVITYTTELKHPGLDTECVICLSEFGIGEKVKVLPKCNHGFHAKCIDKWLNSHSSCPTCRHCLIETCQKIVNSSTTSSIANPHILSNTSSAVPVRETIIRIEPLQREGVVSNNQH